MKFGKVHQSIYILYHNTFPVTYLTDAVFEVNAAGVYIMVSTTAQLIQNRQQ